MGVSNETSYGLCEFVNAAKQHGLPKIVSIQNSYSLIYRGKVSHGNDPRHRSQVRLERGSLDLCYHPLCWLCAGAFECDLAEACAPFHHNVGLLAYSPLAGGSLTGEQRCRLIILICNPCNGHVGRKGEIILEREHGCFAGKYLEGNGSLHDRLNVFPGYMERYNKVWPTGCMCV